MDSELEVIRDQMHQTRASLADKLDALESQVRETVQTATDAVATTVDTVKGVSDTVKDTVEGVTDSVQSTVQSVAETFDISRYAERHPWATFGVAVAAGFAGGYLLGGGRSEAPYRESAWAPPAPGAPAPGAPAPSHQPAQETSLLDSMPEGIKTAISGLQGLAVGAMMGVVGELVRSSVPAQLQGELGGLVDRVTTGLGGKRVDMSFLRKDEAPAPSPTPSPDSQYTAANAGRPAPTPEQPAKRQERRRTANDRR